MTNDFETAKKNFIIDQEEYSRPKLTELMNKLYKWVKVTKEGQLILLKKIPTRKVLRLLISARFIAHLASSEISVGLSKEELKAYSRLQDNVFSTRLSETFRDKFAEEKDGLIQIKNIFLIEQFLGVLKDGD